MLEIEFNTNVLLGLTHCAITRFNFLIQLDRSGETDVARWWKQRQKREQRPSKLKQMQQIEVMMALVDSNEEHDSND